MGLLENIKKEAEGNRTIIQTSEEQELEQKLNKLHYLEKNIPEEIKMFKSIMTRGQETQERKGLHASAVIVSDEKFCYRQQVLSLFYKQDQGEQVKVSLKRIFTEGDAVHEKWQRLFIRGGYSTYKDCDFSRFAKEYDLSYTPDIICTIDGEQMVCEIKSVNTMQFRKMVKERKDHASGRKQLMLYMYLTGIHKGFTLCEDKNTQGIYVRIYEYSFDEIKKYVNRLEKIQEMKQRLLKANKIPKRNTKCSCYDCKMAELCNMRDVCYGKKKERI